MLVRIAWARFDGSQEGQELLVSMPGFPLGEDLTVGDVQRGEQGSCASPIDWSVSTLSTSVVRGKSFTFWTNGAFFWNARKLLIVFRKLDDLQRGRMIAPP
jgi:hypothetical protein